MVGGWIDGKQAAGLESTGIGRRRTIDEVDGEHRAICLGALSGVADGCPESSSVLEVRKARKEWKVTLRWVSVR